MKKYIFGFILLLLFTLSMTACQQNDSEDIGWANRELKKAENQELSSSKEGMSIKAKKNQYATDDKEIIFDFQNNQDTAVTYGLRYQIQKKIDGVWFDIPLKNPIFTEEAYYLEPHSTESQTISLIDLAEYGLTSGEYRMVKNFDDYNLAAPFEITD